MGAVRNNSGSVDSVIVAIGFSWGVPRAGKLLVSPPAPATLGRWVGGRVYLFAGGYYVFVHRVKLSSFW